jgi:hypothetical protein
MENLNNNGLDIKSIQLIHVTKSLKVRLCSYGSNDFNLPLEVILR